MRMLGLGLLLAVFPGLLAAQSQSPDRTADRPTCGHAKAAMTAIMRGLDPKGGAPPAAMEGLSDTDVLHYALDIELDPPNLWLGGTNTMTVRSRVDGLQSFDFRLHDVFDISDLLVGGTAVPWEHTDSATVRVTLDRVYNTDEVFDLYVAYSGYPQSQGGWGSITFRDRNGAREVFTLSQPWYAYTWWPAKDDLGDKTTADLWFTVPDTMVVGSNGALLGIDEVAPGKLRYRWKTDYPTADYLYSIAATNYDQFGTTWTYGDSSMPLQFYIYPEDNTPQHQDFWLGVADTLTVYSDLFGLYPFVSEKYGMAEFGWGGGMEHQTLTSIGGYFDWEDGIVHELAHQWWGDHVTCATWNDIWLNEGFATYCEALWYEHAVGGGPAALHAEMAQRRPSNANGSVYCYDITNPNRIFDVNLSYRKGAWVLHMLRHALGDEAFFATLAAYRSAYAGAAATTVDFQTVAETVSARDLSGFFASWVYGSGIPRYRYAWQVYNVDFQGYIELYIKQVQSASLPVFSAAVEVRVHDQDGNVSAHLLWNDTVEEHLLFPIDSPLVAGLEFDPRPWILSAGANLTLMPDGPPKVVRLIPALDEVVAAADLSALEVLFHKDVIVFDTDIWVEGARTGPLAVSFSYDPDRHAVRLVPTSPLAADEYTFTVNDSIYDPISQQALDGELFKADGSAPLPSGDGVTGAPVVAHFTVTVAGDMNCDGAVSFDDIGPFVLALHDPAAYGTTYPGCPILNADCNRDGSVTTDDVDAFVEVLART